ncbi:MAG: serpin family protein [Thermoanaerobaculia bacterium]
MSRNCFLAALAGLLMVLGCAGADGDSMSEVPLDAQRDLPAVVEGGNLFAVDLYRKLGEGGGNLFFSPLSLSTALAMTSAGAAGETREEMEEVLHFPIDVESVHPSFAALAESLARGSSAGGYRLDIANRLWGQPGFDFEEEFLAVCKQHYGAGFETLDFAKAPEGARETINRWVEKQTSDRIQDLLPPGSIEALTRLVLTNAVYFKGDWQYQFDRKSTVKSPFFAPGDREIEVPLMMRKGDQRYVRYPDFQLLELPYVGDDLSMIVVLPSARDGLAAIEAQLSNERLTGWIRGLAQREVTVYLPRFEMNTGFSMKDTLSEMGMPSAFTSPQEGDPDSADFSRMTGARDLFIDGVFHKAFVKVNEEGTEAAAAAGVTIGLTSMPPEPEIFRADHPFLFLVRDRVTGSILFIGRLVDPGDAG